MLFATFAGMRLLFSALLAAAAIPTSSTSVRADPILVEAESFSDTGGWMLDTQFIEIMGSPYLLAHGMGSTVADATTTVTIPKAGSYRVWVRTKDWVAPWGAEGAPGKFKLAIGGKDLATTFGTSGAEWHWQEGGALELAAGEVNLALRDLTGFDGRCDAILLSDDPAFVPDNSSEVLPAWRRAALGLSAETAAAGEFDLVVVGGGYSGLGAAISAARMGIRVALIQNRDVLGGNGSSEVRVWAMGNTPDGLYPVGDIIRELEDTAPASPAAAETFEDEKKEAIVRAEDKISLFLGHHAFGVEMADGTTIGGVHVIETRTGEVMKFTAPLFVDATGHGYLGMWAGADRKMIAGGRMGMSNMWTWETTEAAQSFKASPWALDLAEADFPYPQRNHAQWFWESGYDKHPLDDLELIRDWNLRASYGAWDAIKNKGAYAGNDPSGQAHANAKMTWLAYVGGTRETQQLLGDVILTEEDIISRKDFPDKAVLSTWSIDLHYPKEQYLTKYKYKDNPFISRAEHGKGVDRKVGYAVPYRCFYSRNIDNLFMAGRNVSVTHKALGTVRVMKTCGMMGVVVGKAAAICIDEKATPRGVYQDHLDELIALMKLPGNMRRDDLSSAFYEDKNTGPMAPMKGAAKVNVPLAKLDGIVIDDTKAKLKGKWGEGSGVTPYVHTGYRYALGGSGAEARFEFSVPRTGLYDLRVAYQAHPNRSKTVPITVSGTAGGDERIALDQTQPPQFPHGLTSIGTFRFEAGQEAAVLFDTAGTTGNVGIDAVQLLRAN